MTRRITSVTGISLWVGLIILMASAQAIAADEKFFNNLPEGWKVQKSVKVPKEQTRAISRKLGGIISKLSNNYLSVHGQSLQVNIVHCRTEKSAQKIYEAMLQGHSGIADYVLRDKNTVIEFVCRDINLVKQAHQIFKGTNVKPQSVAQKRISRKMFRNLPPGWQVKKSFIVPSEQADAVGSKLGARIKRLSNTILSVHGQRLRVNIIEGVTQQDAEKIYKAVLETHYGFVASTFKSGTSVLEFSCDDINLAIKAAWELGLKSRPDKVQYRISFDAAPIKAADFMSWNKLFTLFLELEQSPNDEEIKSQIAELSKRFTFGSEIKLRTCDNAKAKNSYRFKPAVTKTKVMKQGEITRYVFDSLPRKLLLPYVSIEATVMTNKDAFTPVNRKAVDELLQPTKFWPVDDPNIRALARKITAGCKNDEDKVKAILRWLAPNENIEFGGPVTGSRYGVKKVMEQGYGQCWDFSDCFVTFCRASGIPSRQVAGWLYGVSGHVWAEVLFEGKGWQQVDPTGGELVQCGIYHIPYLTSEDGSMSILYLSMPKIEVLSP